MAPINGVNEAVLPLSPRSLLLEKLYLCSNAARMSLAEIVDKDLGIPHVDCQKKEDGWVLIQTDNAEQRAARATSFGHTDTDGNSMTKPWVLPDRPSASSLGKRKIIEGVEEAGGGKRVEVNTRESLVQELLMRRHRAEFLQEEMNSLVVKAEENEEGIRRLKQRLEELD